MNEFPEQGPDTSTNNNKLSRIMTENLLRNKKAASKVLENVRKMIERKR